VIDLGGAPAGVYLNAGTYQDPGPFAHGFKGFCTVFVLAAFSLAGTEFVGIAAAECENPRKAIPRAIKLVFWSLGIFYMCTFLMIGFIVPYNDPLLLNGGGKSGSASPFVIAIEQAGIKVLPSIFNGVIVFSLISVSNLAIFACTRTLTGLADLSQAPTIFKYVDKKGRPIVSILLALTFWTFGISQFGSRWTICV
jgi:yeast amino acid transporter